MDQKLPIIQPKRRPARKRLSREEKAQRTRDSIMAAAYNVAGITYVLGGLLLGIATVRARVLPRWPALLFAVAAASTPLAAVLPHPLNRSLAVPMGLSLAWLGYALWAERRGQQQPATPAWSVTGSAAPKA